MSENWKPKSDVKPFAPRKAYYNVWLPCCMCVWNVRRRSFNERTTLCVLGAILALIIVGNVLFMLELEVFSALFRVQSHLPFNEENVEERSDVIITDLETSSPPLRALGPPPPVNEEKMEKRRDVMKDPKETAKSIDIEVYSSKDHVYASVNGTKVMEKTTPESRGIHVTVLHQSTGVVMANRSFDTCLSKYESTLLVLFLNSISEGRILCLSVMDEGSFQLKKPVHNLLRTFGSIYIQSLKWRDTWAFIVVKRGRKYAEVHHHPQDFGDWGHPVVARATVKLVLKEDARCSWDDSEETNRRRALCDRFEGYGSVCSCSNPAPIDIKSPAISENRVANIPVAIVAGNRAHYLYRGLRSMLSAHGAKKKLFTVFIDGFSEEPAAVARLFDLKVVQHVPISSKNARIAQHYKRTLTETFNMFPDAKYMIILEEDLDVSVDIFSYFSQLLPLMDEDESLYCVSAWNDQGYHHSCNDPAMLYRIETMPGLGWLLKRRIYKEELEPYWPTPDLFWDWDMWMRDNRNRKGRECIIPDISRTYHFGSKGLNVNPFFQELYFTNHALNTEPNVKFNVQQLKKDNYENEIERLMSSAAVLNHTKDPCKNEKDFIPDTTGKTYVFYIEMKQPDDWTTWNNIARCLHIWDLDVRGFHKSMWRLWLKGNHVVIVGSPASPYTKHKPKDVKPIFIPKKKST